MRRFFLVFLSLLVYIYAYSDTIVIEGTYEEKIAKLCSLAKENWEKSVEKTLDYSEQILFLTAKSGDKRNAAFAYLSMGEAYQFNGDFDKAWDSFTKSLECYEFIDDKEGVVLALANIGSIHWALHDLDKAIDYYLESLSISKEIDDSLLIASSLNKLGLAYGRQQKYTEALEFHQEALSIREQLKNNKEIAASLNNIGIIYTEQKKYRKALEFYERALQINMIINRDWGIAEVMNNLGELHVYTKQFEKAIEYLDKAAEISDRIGAKDLIVDNLHYKYYLFDASNKDKQALKYYLQYAALEDTLRSIHESRNLANLNAKYQIEKKENVIKLLEREKEIDKLKKNILTISLLMVLIVAILIYSRQKQKNKASRHKRLRLQDELKHREKELTNFALHIVQRNELLKDVKANFKKMANIDTKTKNQTIRELEIKINYSLRISKELEEFRSHVDKVNYEFFSKLGKVVPSITHNEKRLCALLRLNLSSKEIAFLFNITPKAIDMGRYRLRKKMNIGSSDSLTGFLQNL